MRQGQGLLVQYALPRFVLFMKMAVCINVCGACWSASVEICWRSEGFCNIVWIQYLTCGEVFYNADLSRYVRQNIAFVLVLSLVVIRFLCIRQYFCQRVMSSDDM